VPADLVLARYETKLETPKATGTTINRNGTIHIFAPAALAVTLRQAKSSAHVTAPAMVRALDSTGRRRTAAVIPAAATTTRTAAMPIQCRSGAFPVGFPLASTSERSQGTATSQDKVARARPIRPQETATAMVRVLVTIAFDLALFVDADESDPVRPEA
jgi:hypothetical protein